MDRKLLLTTFAVVFLYNISLAQVYELPTYYGQYFNDPQVAPIRIKNEQKALFLLAHQHNGGDFSGISNSIFIGQFNIGNRETSLFHTIGLAVIVDKEGFLLNRNRFAATYASHIKLNSNYYLAAGVNAGVYNFVVKANDVIGAHSDYALDGILSLKLYSKVTDISLSLSQPTNASIQPLQNETILPRNINLLATHLFTINETISLKPSFYSRYSKKSANTSSGFVLAGGGNVLIKENFMLGYTTTNKRGSNIHLGLENIVMSNSMFDVYLGYFLPHSKNISNSIRRAELFLRYKFL